MNIKDVDHWIYFVHTCITGIAAWLFSKIGILSPLLGMFALMMLVDYITGMLASKYEALEHPGNPGYGWNSQKGAKGILLKVGCLCIIAVAMVVDFIIISVGGEIGLQTTQKGFFAICVTVWYLLNELLSIIENVGRTGVPIPDWLAKYISVLKTKVDPEDK